MISVQDGQNRVLTQITAPTPPEVLLLGQPRTRVLAEEGGAPSDVPPADNSAVDGYAVASADIPSSGTRELAVVAELPAGAVFEGALAPGQAVQIMTGAPMPRGADTAYPQEVVDKTARGIRVPTIKKGANVRMRGEDVQPGTVVVERGTALRPPQPGLLASPRRVDGLCHPLPRAALPPPRHHGVQPAA